MEPITSPILDSNQQAFQPDKNVPDKDKTATLAKGFISESVAYRSGYGYPVEKDKWLAKYRGGANLYEAKAKQPHQFRTNYFKSYVDFNATVLTNVDPSYEVLRRDLEEGGIESDMMGRILKEVLEKNKVKNMEWEDVIWGGIKGFGVERWEWNKEAECGLGFPAGESCDPGQFLVNPGAKSIAKAIYCIYKRPVPTAELRKMFPEMAKDILPEGDLSIDVSSGATETKSFNINGVETDRTIGGSHTNQIDQTTLYEIYFKDPEEVELASIEDLAEWIDTNPGFYGRSEYLKQRTLSYYHDGAYPKRVKKYPFGRKIYFASDKVLEDFPNPYNRPPFFEYQESPDPSSFYGQGLIEKIYEPVSAIHIASVDMARNVRHRTSPPFEVFGYNVQDGKVMKTKAGQALVTKQMGAYIRPVQVPEVAPNDVLSLIGYLQNDITHITGLSPILAGIREPGVYSGAQVEKLQDAALGMVRPKFDRLNGLRMERANFLIWMIQAYMTDQRKFSYLNESEQMEIFEVNQKTAKPEGELGWDTTPTTNVSIGTYEPRIEMGVDRPFSRAEKFQQAAQVAELFQTSGDPITAGKLLINESDVPGKRRLMQKYEQNITASMQAQSQQAQEQMQIQKAVTAKQMELDERRQMTEEYRAEIQKVKAGSAAAKTEADIDRTKSETMRNRAETLKALDEVMWPSAVDAMLDEITLEQMREAQRGRP